MGGGGEGLGRENEGIGGGGDGIGGEEGRKGGVGYFDYCG